MGLDVWQGTALARGFQTMLSTLMATQHLPRPLMKLMTLALLQHTAVLSIEEDMVSRVVLNQDKCFLVKSTKVHVLCLCLGTVSMVQWAKCGCVFKKKKGEGGLVWDLTPSHPLCSACYGFCYLCDQPAPSKTEGQAGIFSWGTAQWWGPTSYGGIVVRLYLSQGAQYTDGAVLPSPPPPWS